MYAYCLIFFPFPFILSPPMYMMRHNENINRAFHRHRHIHTITNCLSGFGMVFWFSIKGCMSSKQQKRGRWNQVCKRYIEFKRHQTYIIFTYARYSKWTLVLVTLIGHKTILVDKPMINGEMLGFAALVFRSFSGDMNPYWQVNW